MHVRFNAKTGQRETRLDAAERRHVREVLLLLEEIRQRAKDTDQAVEKLRELAKEEE